MCDKFTCCNVGLRSYEHKYESRGSEVIAHTQAISTCQAQRPAGGAHEWSSWWALRVSPPFFSSWFHELSTCCSKQTRTDTKKKEKRNEFIWGSCQFVAHGMIDVPTICWTLYDWCANSLLNTVWLMCQQSVEHCITGVPIVCWTLYDWCANSLLNTVWLMCQQPVEHCLEFEADHQLFSRCFVCFCPSCFLFEPNSVFDFMRVSFLTTRYCKAFLYLLLY